MPLRDSEGVVGLPQFFYQNRIDWHRHMLQGAVLIMSANASTDPKKSGLLRPGNVMEIA